MPARLRDLSRLLKQFDIQVVEPGKGSHWRAVGVRDGQRVTFPIPAHNGSKTEIDDKYIASMCRAFGLSLSEVYGMLRGELRSVTR